MAHVARAVVDERRLAAHAGAARAGYDEDADRIAAGMSEAVVRHGLREYYDSRTGAGLAARGFSWSALVADLASA